MADLAMQRSKGQSFSPSSSSSSSLGGAAPSMPSASKMMTSARMRRAYGSVRHITKEKGAVDWRTAGR